MGTGSVEGWVDGIVGDRLRGWAWFPDKPDDVACVEIASNNTVLATVAAVGHREDLKTSQKRGGRCAFEVYVSDAMLGQLGATIEVRVAGQLLPPGPVPVSKPDPAAAVVGTAASSGSADPQLVCIGHSHTKAVAAAAAAAGTKLSRIDFWENPFPVEIVGGRKQFRTEIKDRLNGRVYSMVGGTSYNMIGMLAHPRRFDFVLPDMPELPFDETAELIPFDAVRAALKTALEPYLDLMGLVFRTAGGSVSHIDAPPPFADGDRMLPDIPWMFFEGMEPAVAPAYLRYKLWRLQSDMVQAYCDEHGARFIPHPPSTADANGFLLPAYYFDPMHANQAYGDAVLRQIQETA